MTITMIAVPIILLVAGIIVSIFPDQAGMWFCKLGKANWRICTFGLTDMHWFYREDKARGTGRMLGAMLMLFGVVFATLLIISFSGPNSLAAMREARTYLGNTYGRSQGGWNISCKTSHDGSNGVLVEYKYAGKSGSLRGIWTGKNYVFTEDQR